jgi:NDP-sugar pyrophosphorylase family protein
MKAMILAAGLGTRLRPLTDDRPKALVEVAGRTLLEIALRRMRGFGIREVIVNVHYFGEMIVEYLEKNQDFGMRIEISREEILLDTGGGLKKAAWFFRESAEEEDEPFLLHNVDVISTIDLGRMLEFHREKRALATLAVRRRETSRYLMFDEQKRLCGRRAGRDGAVEMARAGEEWREGIQALAFSGIHIISARMLEMMEEQGAFSIIATYLRLAGRGQNIVGFSSDEYYWRDLGRAEDVALAGEDVKRGRLELDGGDMD